MSQHQELFSIDDTAGVLGGISRTTVYELIKRGDLTKVKLGSRGFITGASIRDYVDRLTAIALSDNAGAA